MAVNNVATRISMSTDKALKSVKDLNKEINNLGKNISLAFQTSKILAFTGVVKNLTTQMINASKAQAGYAESFNLLQVAYKANTEEGQKLLNNTEELINTLKNFYGLDPAGVVKQLGVYKQMTSAVGMTNEVSAKLSENLIRLQQDAASLYNMDFEEVGKKITSALSGQTRAVRILGADITQASLQEELYRLGIERKITSLSRAEKEILIYLTLERQLANANGDAAKTINSVANQTKIFKEQIGMAARQIGAIFIPVLKTLLPILNGIMMAFNAILGFLLGLFGLGGKDLGSEFGISSVSIGIEDIGTNAGKASKAVDDLYGKLRPFDKLNVITTPKKDTSSGVGAGAGGIGGGIDKGLLKAMDDYNDKLQEAKNKAKEIRDMILEWLGFTIDENGEIDGFNIKLGTIIGAIMVGGVIWKGVSTVFGIVKGIGSLLSGVGSVGKGIKNANTVLSGSKEIGNNSGGFKLPKISTILKALAEVALIIGGIIALVQVIGMLNQIEGFKENTTQGLDALKQIFGGLAEVAIPMAGFIAGIALLGDKAGFKKVASGTAGFVIAITGIVGVVELVGLIASNQYAKKFAETGIKTLKTIFNGLAEVAIPMAGFLTAIMLIGNLGGWAAAASGIAGFAIAIGGLELLVIAFGAVSKLPFVKELMQGGFEMMINLARFIGEFAGAIIEGFANMTLTILDDLGIHLSNFMTSAMPFFEGLSIINGDLLVNAACLAGIILAIGASTVITALTSLLDWITGGNSFEKFGEHLADLGKYIKQFGDNVEGINNDNVTTATNAAKVIFEIYSNLPKEGGLAQLATGAPDLKGFSEILPVLGENIAKFSDKVSGKVDGEAVKASIEAAKAIAGMYKELPNVGGLAQLFSGAPDLKGFVDILEKLADDLVSYSQKVKGKIDKGAVDASVQAAKAIMGLYKELPNTGGLAQLFSGAPDLKGFVDILERMADNLVSYSKKVSNNINSAAVNASVQAARAIMQLYKELPNTGGLQELFSGRQDLSGFVNILPKFAENMVKYSQTVSGKIDSGAVLASVNAAESIAELENKLPKTGGLQAWFTGDNSIDKFGNKLYKFGEKFLDYFYKINQVDTGKVNTVTDAVVKLADISGKIKNEGLSNVLLDFSKNLSNSSTGLNNFFSKTNAENIGRDFGTNLGKAIANAIKNTQMPTLTANIQDSNGNNTGNVNSYFKYKADGGFLNSGEIYATRENGIPELVGRIGNRGAVANNDQIVESIAKGLAMSGIGKETNVNIIAKGDTRGLMNFITFEQQRKNRQYGL